MSSEPATAVRRSPPASRAASRRQLDATDRVPPSEALVATATTLGALGRWPHLVDPRELGWPVRAELVQHDRKAVVVRLTVAGGATVYAKRGRWTRIEPEVAVYRGLACATQPLAPRLHGARREGDLGWLFLGAVHGRPFDPLRVEDRERLALWLARLHRATTPPAAWAQRLPRDPLRACRTRVDARADGLRQRLRARLRPSERDELRELAELVEAIRRRWPSIERLAARTPSVLVHGDLGSENLIVASGTADTLVALDWEDATIGTPLVDLGLMDLPTYVREAGDLWSQAARRDLARMQRVGAVLQTVRHRFERKGGTLRRSYLRRLRRQVREADLG